MSDDRLDINAIQQLMIDKLTDQISEADDKKLAGYLAEDESLRAQWQQMKQVHALSRAAAFERRFDPEASWKSLTEKAQAGKVVPIQRRPWLRYAVAAAVLLALAIPAYRYFAPDNKLDQISGTTVKLTLPNGNKIDMLQGQIQIKGDAPVVQDKDGRAVVDATDNNIDPEAMSSLNVPSGKNFQMKLADGSEVWLNAASNLDFPIRFNKNTREVTLSGEAFFKIAHNAAKPFIVNVNGMKVQVLGTEFNVKAYPGEKQQAALVKGKVAIQNVNGGQVTIEPGQQAMIQPGTTGIAVNSFDESVVLGWMNGMYYFQDEELKDIAQIIQRWFDVKFNFSDPAIAGLHFSGALNKNKPLAEFLDILGKTSGTRYTINDNVVTFSK